jgi:predicted nucleic acid-binding protein
MRVLIDTDVTLDFLLMRQPFAQAARDIFKTRAQNRLDGYISAITPVNVFHLARKAIGQSNAHAVVGDLLTIVAVCPLDATILMAAHGLPMTDFEDAVQAASAQAAGLDAIVTRNSADYTGAPLPVLTPPNSWPGLRRRHSVDCNVRGGDLPRWSWQPSGERKTRARDCESNLDACNLA